MDPERWHRIRAVCQEALERETGERAAFLDRACAGDAALRREVESLLAYDERGASFLETPALEVMAKNLAEERAASVSSAGRFIGRTISHYQVVEKLGGGGMGVVYRAEDSKLRRFVALKFLPEELEKDHAAFERLRREAQAASALNHPNICTVYDIDEFEGRPFIAMELLEGQTLKHRLEGPGTPTAEPSPLPLDTLLELAIQIADALDAAHARGIIHRDLKPQNIFVTARCQAKLLDFGIAKQITTGRAATGQITAARAEATSDAITSPGAVMGTAPYMSPEQARGELLDARTDLFSFGAVLYEMATGQHAFPGDTSALVFDAILNRQPAPISELNPKIPLQLEDIIHKALEKERDVRYQTASDLRADLKRLKRDTASGRAAVAPVYARRAAKGRSKAWARGAAGVVLVLASVAAVLLRPTLPAPRVLGFTQLSHDGQDKMGALATDGTRIFFSQAVRLATVSVAGGETVPIPTPMETPVIDGLSPGGTQLLVTDLSVEDEAGNNPLYLVSPVDGSTRRLGNVMASCGGWLQDGRVVFGKGSELYVVQADGTGLRKILTASSGIEWLGASPDGKLIRFASGGMWEVGVDGTNLHALRSGGKDQPSAGPGMWTPEGKYFLFGASRQDFASIWAIREKNDLLHRISRTPVPLTTTGPMNVTRPTPSPDGKRIFVLGMLPHRELRRYDPATRNLMPYLGGIAAWWLSSSRDGNWVAYASVPEDILWRSKADGSDRIQLTFAPTSARQPRWSPDGKQIAFMARLPGQTTWSICVIPSGGGLPERLLSDDQDEMRPDWGLDGKRIVFVRTLEGGKNDLRIVNLETRQMKAIPGSEGHDWPRWSPDGRYLVARDSNGALDLFDFTTQTWKGIVKPGLRPLWSSDGKYIYFLKGTQEIMRFRLSDHSVESVVDLKTLRLASGFQVDPSISLAPDNSLILPLEATSTEIYALDWDAP